MPRAQLPPAKTIRVEASGGMALGLVLVGVALLPFLTPKGPGNSSPVDAVMAVAVVAVVVWAGVSGSRLHVPYAGPTAGLVIVGTAAALLSAAPKLGGIAVAQEIFLLAWCAAVTSVCRTPSALRAVLRTWCLTSVVWGGLLVGAVLAGHPSWAGISGSHGGRARQLFDHPNMSGNYYVIMIFVLVAARCPRRGSARAGAVTVLAMAAVFAGSNTAFLGLGVGGLLALYLNMRKRSGHATASTMVAALLLAGGTLWSVAAGPVQTMIEGSDNPVVKYSVGRAGRSAEDRQSLFASQYQLFEQNGLLGVGPSGTRRALDALPVFSVKESHNDYLATLVERGPLGVLALLALLAAIALRTMSVVSHPLSPGFAAVVPNPEALAGAFVAFAVTAVTHEVLHYRHLWTMLAVVAALHLFGRTRPGAGDADRDSGADSTASAAPDDFPLVHAR